MFPFTHTYVLGELYRLKDRPLDEIDGELLVGNFLLDVVVNSRVRSVNGGFQAISHDVVRQPGEGGYDLTSRIGTGLTIHVMADNYANVGHYWRSNSPREKRNDRGFITGRTPLVYTGGLEDKTWKPEQLETFKRRILQCGLDISMLRDSYETALGLMRKATGYLGKNLEDIRKEFIDLISKATDRRDVEPETRKQLIEAFKETMRSSLESFLSRYHDNLAYQASTPIRAYSAIKKVSDHGLPDNSVGFLETLKKEPCYGVVMQNVRLLRNPFRGHWKEHLESAARSISASHLDL